MVGYRIAENGDIELWRVTNDGYFRIIEGDNPPPVPACLVNVLRLRKMIHDPKVNDIFYVASLPDSAPPCISFTTGDGVYFTMVNGEWKKLPLKFTDSYIVEELKLTRSVWTAAIALIDRLIARIDPDDYIVSGNAGGQSISFPSLGDMIEFYRALRERFVESESEEMRMNSGLYLSVKRNGVGGVWEYENRCLWALGA